MRKIFYVFIIIFSFKYSLFAQQPLSSDAIISVITCGPGNELYSAFGHSAFRVFDANLEIDKVYNYGTFDFNAPNFYFNFAKGKLTYQLSTTSFTNFMNEYYYEQRWVKLQILNLNQDEVQQVYNFLENNAKPEHKNYRYDFFFNNCSTKIASVLTTAIPKKITFNFNQIQSHKTFRDLIADYTSENFKWAKFGIDLALGSVIDRKATKIEYSFLPDYMFEQIENGTILTSVGQQQLVKETHLALDAPKRISTFSFSQPIPVFNFILLIVLWFTYRNYSLEKRSKWLDFSLYFITGIVGIVVLLLWFATSHTATYNNFNILWAFAPNTIVAFFMLKSKLAKWIKIYNRFLIMLLFAMLILWIFKVQVYNLALIPLLIALSIHYYFLIRFISVSKE